MEPGQLRGKKPNSIVSSDTASKCRLASVPDGERHFPVTVSNLPPLLPKNKKKKKKETVKQLSALRWGQCGPAVAENESHCHLAVDGFKMLSPRAI